MYVTYARHYSVLLINLRYMLDGVQNIQTNFSMVQTTKFYSQKSVQFTIWTI